MIEYSPRHVTVDRGQGFLEFLTTCDLMEPLCKHPFITAFLDIHYSNLKKYRAQAKDSMPHLVMIMLLLELSSTNDHQQQQHTRRYVNVLGTCFLILIFSLDVIALLGLQTPWIDKLLQHSLVKDRRGSGLKKACQAVFSSPRKIVKPLIHLIGYFIAMGLLTSGFGFQKDAAGQQIKLSNTTVTDRLHCTPEAKKFRLILQITMITYSILLAIKESLQIALLKDVKLYLKRNKVDVIAIMATCTTGMAQLMLNFLMDSKKIHMHGVNAHSSMCKDSSNI